MSQIENETQKKKKLNLKEKNIIVNLKYINIA